MLSNREKYEYLPFPSTDRWGAVMLNSHPLSKKKSIKAKDLIGQPLFCSEQSWNLEIREWAGDLYSKLRLEGSFRLSYNASKFAKSVGIVVIDFKTGGFQLLGNRILIYAAGVKAAVKNTM
ncbi:hypothetical protein [Butyrivibrio sp. AE2032]|uniref:hypothetical protein n=1 Tax=Butyrivibrio sp. AE2032 TaxID=1458463 RepID=UPI00054E4A93|nr:hypothetical protein [Butyrivibrio sp. AE2032]